MPSMSQDLKELFTGHNYNYQYPTRELSLPAGSRSLLKESAMLNQKEIKLVAVKSTKRKNGFQKTTAQGTYKGKPFVGAVMKFGPLFEVQLNKKSKAS